MLRHTKINSERAVPRIDRSLRYYVSRDFDLLLHIILRCRGNSCHYNVYLWKIDCEEFGNFEVMLLKTLRYILFDINGKRLC